MLQDIPSTKSMFVSNPPSNEQMQKLYRRLHEVNISQNITKEHSYTAGPLGKKFSCIVALIIFGFKIFQHLMDQESTCVKHILVAQCLSNNRYPIIFKHYSRM